MNILKIAFCLYFCILGLQAIDKNYTDLVLHFKDQISAPAFKGAAYDRLAYITDTYGPRMWGSNSLQQTIYEMMNMAHQEGFENVRLQAVKNFTKWVRGSQSLTLLSPRPTPTKLDVIGLGDSVSGNIEAEVIVVKDKDQLILIKQSVKGKIVCFNNDWKSYGQSVQYRMTGASLASRYGALAVLIRSVTPFSISSVHTGVLQYDQNFTKIPGAAITVQDAQMFERMQQRGQKIVVHLIMENQFVPNSYSNNLVFQIIGSEKPDQIVVAGGHIDTWDTGSQTGANDDGGGFITVFQALRLILQSGFRPKRTLRFAAWSGQEFGGDRGGSHAYYQTHIDQLHKHVAAFKSDLGSTQLIGFGHTGPGQSKVKQIFRDYLSLLGAGNYSTDGISADVYLLYEAGVPVFSNMIVDTPDHDFYFKYHHAAGDSMSMMDPDQMDSNVVGIASLLYILADMQVSLRQNIIQNKIQKLSKSFIDNIRKI